MTTVEKLLFISIALVIVRGVYTLIVLIVSLKWLNKNSNVTRTTTIDKSEGLPNIYIIIPALREQSRIEQTLKYFLDNILNKKINLVVVTTQKEFERNFQGKSTQEIVLDFINNNPTGMYITHLDFPNKSGSMADQLNFALKSLNDSNAFVTIYNADSKPHPDTFKVFYSEYIKDKSNLIFQQSAIFTKNYDELGKLGRLNGLFLQACAILQTRWTLVHEISRYLRLNLPYVSKYLNAHIVGHGLIIRLDLLRQVGGFPTQTLTEDLFLGYIIRSLGYKIIPLPVLELADSPASITANWKQKYVWFWGPLKYTYYFRYVLAHTKDFKNNTFVAFVLMLQGLLSAIAWMISGPFVVVLLLSPFLGVPLSIVILAFFSLILYGPLQYFIIYDNFPLLYKLAGENRSSPTVASLLKISIMSIPVIIFHSLPPFQSLLNEILSNIRHTEVYKPKTGE